ncbi:MAG: BlaI/MecI/CopY family transcriptional regulator [Anaerostipes sp.]|jgi:hypothetical protein|nr:BlaI/MecI/CopY family transcriptional regulator [Anaerostipes sp.]MDD3745428.1 BlaI/MecI/CopY family transcriptional regulator [Anaerostipes sp.]
MKHKKLTKRQLDIMKIFWNSEESLTASDVEHIDSSLNINTIRTSIQTLLKNRYIETADVVYSGTVLARSYKPLISAEEYIQDTFSGFKKQFSSQAYLAHMIDETPDLDAIKELEARIKKRRKELEEEL